MHCRLYNDPATSCVKPDPLWWHRKSRRGDWSVQVGVGFYHFPGLFLPPCLITEYINNVHKQYPQTHTHTHTPASQTSRHSHLKHQYPLYSKHKTHIIHRPSHINICKHPPHQHTFTHHTPIPVYTQGTPKNAYPSIQWKQSQSFYTYTVYPTRTLGQYPHILVHRTPIRAQLITNHTQTT